MHFPLDVSKVFFFLGWLGKKVTTLGHVTSYVSTKIRLENILA